MTVVPWRTLFQRGWRRRCPACGVGAVFERGLKMHTHCAACGVKYLEDQGALWGYLLLVDRALFILPLIVVIYFRVYNPNSVWYWFFVAGLLAGMIGTLPHRNAISLGLDYRQRCRDKLGRE